MICYGIFTGCDLTTRDSYFTILLKFSWISFQHKTHISRIIYSKQNIRLWSQKPQISTKLFGIVTILKAFLSMISGIIPSLYWVKVFQTSFLQIAKTRQLPIQIFIYYLIYWGARNVFHKTMQLMFLKEVSIFNTCLVNNISCFISNLFNLKLNKLNLDWSQESYSLYFENILSCDQGTTITIKLPYVITYVCQNFGIRDVCFQIPKRIYRASYLLPSDFPNNFS